MLGCGSPQQNKLPMNQDSSKTFKDSVKVEQALEITTGDTIILIGKTPVWIRTPKQKVIADILVLPGWNFEKEKICRETDFCDKALAKGYRLILPEMMKSVYASKYYPETRKDYTSFLTLTWVTDTMLPTLQKEYNVFTGPNNYLHGISTGSRGAALVHMNTGKLFSKVVLLSGDFNNATMQTDNLLKNIFGPYNEFKDRWIANDNPWGQTAQWTAQLYIAHGNQDDVVDFKQSLTFADKIKNEHPECRIEKNFIDAKHDFNFWNSTTDAVLAFFAK